MDKNKKLIVIGGPTASGKTALAVKLALELGAEVFSADSRQIYRELNIGVARPTAEEMQGIPHHFINCVSIHEDYSVGRYEAELLAALDTNYQNRDTAILVGGTGLYLKAITHGIDSFPDIPEEINVQLQTEWETSGLDPLTEELLQKDPATHATLDLQNPRRVLRALAVIRATGQPFSAFKSGENKERPFSIDYHILQPDRDQLYDRINRRVDHMMELGLLEEARALYPFRHLKALETVGYSELFAYFDGACTLQEAIDKIKQHTRNYAKRQTTWFRRYPS